MRSAHLPLCGITSFVCFPMAVCHKGKENVCAGELPLTISDIGPIVDYVWYRTVQGTLGGNTSDVFSR